MRLYIRVAVLLLFASPSFAQLNMSLLSQINYGVDLSDIWGYVAPDGTEYAIVGLNNGVSIVSLADPNNATEVARIPGQNSIWRDIKTWGEYAYVTTDQGGTTEGLTVIDLRDLPNSAPFFHWTPDLPDLGVLRTCHNIYIDEFGFAYLSGCNVNNGGILYIDVHTQPGTPIYVDKGENRYSHDVYVRNNLSYSAEISDGTLGVYDVTDKAETIPLGYQTTPFAFTHNVWLSDDSNFAFTTDERPNAPVTAYDVSDPENIIELDQYRPLSTLGEGVIPHNTHVWNDWLIISYYTDGCKVVDASRPHNLVEVGNFDTFLGLEGGFNGAWGAYPFLPSGIVLVSDINSGLYVLGCNYVRAAWLEGIVTDASNSLPLDQVNIVISGAEPNSGTTNLIGEYATGLAIPGTYDVTFTKPGYQTLTVSTSLVNGELTELNVALQPLQAYTVSGNVVSTADNAGIGGAKLVLRSESATFEIQADSDGTFNLSGVFQGTYQVLVGAWGYQYSLIEELPVNGNENVTLALTPGYEDNFALDLGWTASTLGGTIGGRWERGEPIGTYRTNGASSNPEFDLDNDLGDACYVTGNAGGDVSVDDVDGGPVVLTSPEMQLASQYNEPVLHYSLWFYNDGGNGSPNDSLVVRLSNGQESVLVESVRASAGAWRASSTIVASDFLTVTDNMTIIFETGDLNPTGHLVEAAVDGFSVSEGNPIATADLPKISYLQLSPNPFNSTTQIRYMGNETLPAGARLVAMNQLGQVIETAAFSQNTPLEWGKNWPAGTYFIALQHAGQNLEVLRVVKQ